MNAKKIALSSFVVLMFVLYSLQQRHEASQVVVTPATTTSTAAQPSGQSQATPVSNVNTTQTTDGLQTAQTSSAAYKDGTYTGTAADAFYGYIQVQANIKGGKITDVKFLQYPNDRNESVEINSQAMPYLKQEALSAQSSKVHIISGATDTSNAFIESLGSALAKAS